MSAKFVLVQGFSLFTARSKSKVQGHGSGTGGTVQVSKTSKALAVTAMFRVLDFGVLGFGFWVAEASENSQRVPLKGCNDTDCRSRLR